MNVFKPFTTPELFFRPAQIARRVGRYFQRPTPETAEIVLPWGDRLWIHPKETIGSFLWLYGIFDLPVAEVLLRLAEKGQTVADVGANIGQMTTLLRRAVGSKGKVLAFEPHPKIREMLDRNMHQMDLDDHGTLQIIAKAVSRRMGTGYLDIPETWEKNQGTAKLTDRPGERTFRVETTTLAAVHGEEPFTLLKVDVEGHERDVLEGGASLFAQQSVRDIVFEDISPGREAVRFLVKAGYVVFALESSLFGLELISKDSPKFGDPKHENFLATADAARASALLQPKGWKALRSIQ